MSNPTKQFVPSVGIYSLSHDDTWCGSLVYRTGNSFRPWTPRNRCWSQRLLLLLLCGCCTRMFLEEESEAIVCSGGSARCIENELPKGEESGCCCWSGGGSRNAWTVNDVMVVVIAAGKISIIARSNSTVLPWFINMARRPSTTTRRYEDSEHSVEIEMEEMKEGKEAEFDDAGCGGSSRARSW